MCGRYKLTTPTGVIFETFSLTGPRLNLRPRFNIAPTQDAPVIRSFPTGRQLAIMRWGLVPQWAPDTKMAASAINARAETVAEKPTFREALQSRRCLIPADGFYEWTTQGKTKQPHMFQVADGGVFAFAGLWERWEKGSEPLETFTIIVAPANPSVSHIHHRMPVILTPDQWERWLDVERFDAAAVLPLLQTPDIVLTAKRVSPKVNKVENDDESVLVEEPEREPTLF